MRLTPGGRVSYPGVCLFSDISEPIADTTYFYLLRPTSWSFQLRQTSEQAPDTSTHHLASTERQLLIDSRKYASENRWVSWWHLLSTITLLSVLVGVIFFSTGLWLRSACSLLIALTLVRLFIIYHDFLHQAIFKDSPIAAAVLKFYGHLMLTPPEVWKRSHDHHHRHNSKMFGASIGSFPIMTISNYLAATRAERLEYRLARSPWVIVFGYLTVFLFGMCIYPLLCDFKKNVLVLGTLVLHFGLIALGIYLVGWQFTCFAFVFPTWLAMVFGSYLFYIQHNFPSAQILSANDWSYADAALISSSYLETGVVLRWFTGNIGFHHVHHLNAKIPFYRLPEAMSGLVGLQTPGRTSFALKDIISCLKLKLWDSDRNEFVTFAAVAS